MLRRATRSQSWPVKKKLCAWAMTRCASSNFRPAQLKALPTALNAFARSVKLGAVGLSEQFIASDPPKPKELKALREEVRAALERPARELHGTRWQHATGTSGTILAIGTALRLRAFNDAERQEEGARPAG